MRAVLVAQPHTTHGVDTQHNLFVNSGTLKLLGGNGRVDKSIEAHSGAVLAVRWSPDGEFITLY